MACYSTLWDVRMLFLIVRNLLPVSPRVLRAVQKAALALVIPDVRLFSNT